MPATINENKKKKKARITEPRPGLVLGLASSSMYVAAASIAGEGGAPPWREASVPPPRAPHHGPPAALMLDPPPWSRVRLAGAGIHVPPRAYVERTLARPLLHPQPDPNRGRGRGCGSERRHHGSAPRCRGSSVPAGSRCNRRTRAIPHPGAHDHKRREAHAALRVSLQRGHYTIRESPRAWGHRRCSLLE